jgi:hypothetical protein
VKTRLTQQRIKACKLTACGLCKPWKQGWADKKTARDTWLAQRAEQQLREGGIRFGGVYLSKASEELEARRVKHAFDEVSQAWWWFDPASGGNVHEFPASWEILRHTAPSLLKNAGANTASRTSRLRIALVERGSTR